MTRATQHKLWPPEKLGWVVEFAEAVVAGAAVRRWQTSLAYLCQMGLALPGSCDCTEDHQRGGWMGKLKEWQHNHHAEFNRRIRAAITTVPGARSALRMALYRDVTGVAPDPETPEQGRVFPRPYGRLILDFLRDKPTKAWFRDPPPEGQLYQGSALQDQHLTH